MIQNPILTLSDQLQQQLSVQNTVKEGKRENKPVVWELSTGIPCFIVLHKCCGFLQIEGKNLRQQKDYDSLYRGGLGWSPQYLRGGPVFECSTLNLGQLPYDKEEMKHQRVKSLAQCHTFFSSES